ncbi:Transposable element Tcb2 transposase [Anthophora plagiata]
MPLRRFLQITRKLNEADNRLITRILKKDPTISAVSLAQEISEIQQTSISASTIRRSLNSQGMHGRVPRKKPAISAKNRMSCSRGVYSFLTLTVCDMALFNSYILYNKNSMAKKQNYSEYRLQIAEGLLQTVLLQNYNRQGPLLNGNIPMRLQSQHWGHFPNHIDPTPLKKIQQELAKYVQNIRKGVKLHY